MSDRSNHVRTNVGSRIPPENPGSILSIRHQITQRDRHSRRNVLVRPLLQERREQFFQRLASDAYNGIQLKSLRALSSIQTQPTNKALRKLSGEYFARPLLEALGLKKWHKASIEFLEQCHQGQ
ncbi:MAG: hypothetical protein ACK5YW_10165 [Betaproteobacteria bacterium]